MTLFKFVCAISCLSLSTLSSASDSSAAKAQLLQADYTSASGTVEFRASGHPSTLHVTGKGAGPVGSFSIKRDIVTGKLSFDLNTLDTGIALRDEHMKTKYLEVGQYPQAELKISELKLSQPLSPQSTSLSAVPFQGTLKLHGVEKPVIGTVDLKTTAPGILQTGASFALKLSDYGINIPKYAGITIADDVQITVNSAAQIH
jgi:polyisoprenoid-binding protein YceI